MKLASPITLKPYPYTDQKTNKLVEPPDIVLDELRITFYDQPHLKVLAANIEKVPAPIMLATGANYDALGDYKKSDLEPMIAKAMGDDPAVFLQAKFPRTLEADPNGPGTILAGMISAMGIKSTPNCSCRRHALEMNSKGPDWCDENIGLILAWLEEESKKRSLPFVRTVAKLMVQRAISRSRRLLAKEAAASA